MAGCFVGGADKKLMAALVFEIKIALQKLI